MLKKLRKPRPIRTVHVTEKGVRGREVVAVVVILLLWAWVSSMDYADAVAADCAKPVVTSAAARGSK